eukprot:6420754-Pyramimonas_sp.AAC.1
MSIDDMASRRSMTSQGTLDQDPNPRRSTLSHSWSSRPEDSFPPMPMGPSSSLLQLRLQQVVLLD